MATTVHGQYVGIRWSRNGGEAVRKYLAKLRLVLATLLSCGLTGTKLISVHVILSLINQSIYVNLDAVCSALDPTSNWTQGIVPE